ncbi:MAG: hypothetical protein ACR2H1_01370, partial [Limisphaerales bacterium]
IDHYYFNLTNASDYTPTATPVWNRQNNQTAINDLDFFLYDSQSNLIASSVSAVDNTEHIFLARLVPGRYDLQVLKNGGTTKRITSSESYALSFEFFTMSLNLARSGNNLAISWPMAPAGFILQSTANLNPPILWSNVTNPLTITSNQNRVTLDSSSENQFFRLRRP